VLLPPDKPASYRYTEHFDRAVLHLPRRYSRTRWGGVILAALLFQLPPILLTVAILATVESGPLPVVGALGLLSALALALWRYPRKSVPYVEVTISDRVLVLKTLRPASEVTVARDDIQALEVTAAGLQVQTSGEPVLLFAGRPPEETAWLKALLERLSRERAGRSAIPAALRQMTER